MRKPSLQDRAEKAVQKLVSQCSFMPKSWNAFAETMDDYCRRAYRLGYAAAVRDARRKGDR